MPFFVYSCITSDGTQEWRSGSYGTLVELCGELERRREKIDLFYELPDWTHRLLQFRRRLGPDQVVEFCNYLSLYVGGGLDLQIALGDLAQGGRNVSIKAAAHEMRQGLLNGLSLSETMTRTGQFPEVVIGMVRIGETSGNLAELLQDAAEYIERNEEIKSATRRAMVYPAFTLVAMTGALVFWMLFVVPRMVHVFKNMDIELPLPTKALIAMSDFFSSEWFWLVVAIAALFVVLSAARRQSNLRLAFDRALWNLPILGPIVRNSQEAFYFQYLALVYKAGVPITDAVARLVDSVQNRYFRSRVARIPEFLRIGLSLREAFARMNIFQALDIRMIAIGEQTGALEEQLAKLASIYFNRTQAAVAMLTKAIEPLLIVVLGGFFVFFVIALMWPIYEIVQKVMSQIGGA